MHTIHNDKPIGESIKPLLLIIENAIWNFEADKEELPKFDDDAFRATIKIFATALIERIWKLQEDEHMFLDDRVQMALSAAKEIQKIVKVYANIDTKELYKEFNSEQNPPL
jgi:hypothetical protein